MKKLLLQSIFGTVHDIEQIIDKLCDLHIGYCNEEERQSVYDTICIYEKLIGDLRRETAKAEGDTRYEDYQGTFHNV